MDSVMGDPTATASQDRHLDIRFTGSGSEYFRIWIVNLVLTVLTLSLYYPWAKVRRLRYFYGNTLVDGTPLGFHGEPKKMLRGYLLVSLLFLLYSIAGQFSVAAGLIALALVAAVAPAMLKSSMRFRLANTSWRGMRMRFSGSLADAYRAVLPLALPVLAMSALPLLLARPGVEPGRAAPLFGAVALLSVAVLPWVFWSLKRYQHDNYALATLTTRFKAPVSAFYSLALRIVGVSLLGSAVLGVLTAVLGFALRMGMAKPQGGLQAGLMALLPLLLTIGLLVVGKTYATSRLQNLVWTKTGNRSMRFMSDLQFSRLGLLTLKNWALMAVTLGLYWPFAAVATTRMRLEAVRIKTRVDPATLVSQIKASDGDAAGDAAGDVLGLDIGL